MTDDLTDTEKRVRDLLSDPRKHRELREMARVTRSEWEWRRAAEVLRRFYAKSAAPAKAAKTA